MTFLAKYDSMPANSQAENSLAVGERIRNLSGLAMLVVVLIHAFNPDPASLGPCYCQIQASHLGPYLSWVIQRPFAVAVPLFFGVSGYLFFVKIAAGKSTLSESMLRRVKTVLVPFLLWVLIGIVVASLMRSGGVHAGGTSELSSPSGWLDQLAHPVFYQLWFMRALIYLVLLTPFMYPLLRWKHALIPLTVAFLVASCLRPQAEMLQELVAGSYFWFGAYIAVHRVPFDQPVSTKVIALLGLTWIGFWGVTAALWTPADEPLMVCLLVIGNMCGIAFLWYALPAKATLWTSKAFRAYLPYVIFVYLSHVAVLGPTKRLLLEASGNSAIAQVFSMTLAAVITVVTCVAAATLLHKVSRPVYGLLTGGRAP